MTHNTRYARRLGIKPQGDSQLFFLAEAAYLWFYLGAPRRAEQIFQGLTVLAPNDPIGFVGLAELLLASGEWRGAAVHARSAISSQNIRRQGLAFAYYLLGQAELGQANLTEAERCFDRVMELDGTGPVGAACRCWCKILSESAATLPVAAR